MLKSILRINGIKVLDKSSQKSVSGGFGGEYGECAAPSALSCGVPGHICCRGNCVLPTSQACN